jgi:hypothetical protein
MVFDLTDEATIQKKRRFPCASPSRDPELSGRTAPPEIVREGDQRQAVRHYRVIPSGEAGTVMFVCGAV